MKRIFLDANVLFTAAHNPRGKAAFIVEGGRDELWKLYSSAYAVTEAGRNLEIKFPEQMAAFEILLGEIQITRHQVGDIRLAGLDNKGQPIFQAALACSATHLVTGDRKDFGKFMNKPGKTSGIVIQTPADFLRQFDLP